jgi:ketosteroid isomerase-like protein
MIGSDLEGADLESRVASWAASAISDDAAAVRAVIEAYGDRLAAADAAGVVSQYTGNAAVMQPELETVVGSQQLTATYDAAFENMRLDFTFRFDDITVKGDLAAVRATSQGRSRSALPARRNQRVSGSCSFWNARGPLGDHAVHVPADAGAVRRGLLRHLASPPPGFGHVPHPLAVAEHDAASAVALVYLPVQGPCR